MDRPYEKCQNCPLVGCCNEEVDKKSIEQIRVLDKDRRKALGKEQHEWERQHGYSPTKIERLAWQDGFNAGWSERRTLKRNDGQ